MTEELSKVERRYRIVALHEEVQRRAARAAQSRRGGLLEFVKYFWDVLEPETEFVPGWPLEAVCKHLEAVSYGEIKRLLINVPPGFMKSLLTDVFWPAWEWGALNQPHLRYVSFSYAASLTIRDNGKFRDLIHSRKYKELYGRNFGIRKWGEIKITNNKTGSKLATSVGGVGTGERGDRVIVDDPHNVKEGESEAIRTETVRWFREALTNRLNSISESAIVIIMQRVHEDDVSGAVLGTEGYEDYVHLMIPMEYDPDRHCSTKIDWEDPRTIPGELAWEERFSAADVANLTAQLGPYAYAGQYQQAPAPRGGGIFKRDWWQLWESPDDSFPPMEYVLVSADTAYTERETNDPTGCTVWGLWHDKGAPRVMLMYAWRKHLEMNGVYTPRLPDETNSEFERRTKPHWGLVEWLAYTCRRYKADRLIIEGKASGLTAMQEVQRLHGTEGWGVQVVQPSGDKVARAYAVQPIWSQFLVHAPDKEWADDVISEMAAFPKGRYKDLTDSATQAMKFFREAGFIVHRHEAAFDTAEAMRQRPVKPTALYPS